MKERASRRSFLTAVIASAAAMAVLAVGVYSFLFSGRGEERKHLDHGTQLTAPKSAGKMSVEEALARRRSRREYTDEGLTMQEVSQLLWAAQGITEPGPGFRTAPSAGGTYPIEIYMVVKKGGVEGLEAGVYHYDPRKNSLGVVAKGDFSQELMVAAVDQQWVGDAALNLVITGFFERTTQRYGDRGVHYVYMEVGHVGQNVYLQAESLGLGTVAIGAFYDSKVQEILRTSKDEVPLYVMPVAKPKP